MLDEGEPSIHLWCAYKDRLGQTELHQGPGAM